MEEFLQKYPMADPHCTTYQQLRAAIGDGCAPVNAGSSGLHQGLQQGDCAQGGHYQSGFGKNKQVDAA